jgi:hypothetical protein
MENRTEGRSLAVRLWWTHREPASRFHRIDTRRLGLESIRSGRPCGSTTSGIPVGQDKEPGLVPERGEQRSRGVIVATLTG